MSHKYQCDYSTEYEQQFNLEERKKKGHCNYCGRKIPYAQFLEACTQLIKEINFTGKRIYEANEAQLREIHKLARKYCMISGKYDLPAYFEMAVEKAKENNE